MIAATALVLNLRAEAFIGNPATNYWKCPTGCVQISWLQQGLLGLAINVAIFANLDCSLIATTVCCRSLHWVAVGRSLRLHEVTVGKSPAGTNDISRFASVQCRDPWGWVDVTGDHVEEATLLICLQTSIMQ